jgi:biotin synthase
VSGLERFLEGLTQRITEGGEIGFVEAYRLAQIDDEGDIITLLPFANRLRHHFKGKVIDLCSIVNAKSGGCSEDCIFCAQSARHSTDVSIYPLLGVQEIVDAARTARDGGANRFGIVTSGASVRKSWELTSLYEAIGRVKGEVEINCCASLGSLTEEGARSLKEAGLERYHHNLETAESFFPRVCTTHRFSDRKKTETVEHRIELAFELKELRVDSIPLNFLVPVAGTPVEHVPPVAPLEILKTVALFRFILPDKDIRMCGGREVHLRGLQPFIYVAGANGTLVGNYLTTEGRSPAEDIQDIRDLGLFPAGELRD